MISKRRRAAMTWRLRRENAYAWGLIDRLERLDVRPLWEATA